MLQPISKDSRKSMKSSAQGKRLRTTFPGILISGIADPRATPRPRGAALPADLCQLGGEREGIGRVFEQRVGGDLDLVEEGVGVGVGDPERKRVAEEMDLVPPGGQLQPELRGDDPASTVGRVADDADFQLSSCRVFHGTTEYCWTGSETGTGIALVKASP